MTDTDFPSKTDSEPVQPMPPAPVVPQAQAAPDVIALSSGEIELIKNLEDKNRFLTMILGDRQMTVVEAEKELSVHRDKLKEAYSYVLTAKGLARGKIDTVTGTVTVVERLPKE